MARKFKVGDTVEVAKEFGKEAGEGHGIKLGRKGKVVFVESEILYPYEVAFRGKQKNKYFKPQELKLIKRKGN